MKLKTNENELIIKEAPGCLWIFGLFFIGVAGTILYGSLGGFTNYREIPPWQIALAFFMGSIGVAAGFWIIYVAPVTTVRVDKRRNILALTRRGITGKTEDIYTLAQVKDFCLIEETDSEGEPIFSLGLDFVGGQIVKLSSLASPSEGYKRDLVYRANEFLARQRPSFENAFDDRDENTHQMR